MLTHTEHQRDAATRELEVMRELVKAKDEMIMLLKDSPHRPN